MASSDLLKPDPVVEERVAEDEEEDLEALRLAALNSIKPKNSAPAVVKSHPSRNNLLSIVPAGTNHEARPIRVPPRTGIPALNPVIIPDFSRPPPGYRHDDIVDKFVSDNYKKLGQHHRNIPEKQRVDEEEVSEYEEYSEYETVTDDESGGEDDNEANNADGKEKSDADRSKTDTIKVKKIQSVDETDPDVLLVDCAEEEDEFNSLLKEFESEEKKEQKKKEKKTKKVRVVKKRRIVKPLRDRTPQSLLGRRQSPLPWDRYQSHRSRSPYGSPYRSGTSKRSPPTSSTTYRRHPSPRRSRSPLPSRRSRSPHCRRQSPHYPRDSYYSPPKRLRSPPRGESAPRIFDKRPLSKEKDSLPPRRRLEEDSKSKSLPPSHMDKKNGQRGDDSKSEAEKEAAKEAEFQERLKRLPTPDREKVLARRQRFANASIPGEVVKKVISLKAAKETTPEGARSQRAEKQSRNKEPIMSDLRQQLHKRKMDTRDHRDEGSIEKEQLDPDPRRRKAPKRSRTDLDRNVFVPSDDDDSGDTIIRQALEKSSPAKKRSVMARLGKPVHLKKASEESIEEEMDEVRASPPKKKSEKKEKKKEKKEKKKEKKEKKKKKKSKKKRRSSDTSSEDDSDDDKPKLDLDQEELLSFFEQSSKAKKESGSKKRKVKD